MNVKAIAGVIVALFIQTGVAHADHNYPINSTAALKYETDELAIAVSNSWIGFQVKTAVRHYVNDVNRLIRCVRFATRRPIFNDHTEDPGIPRACAVQLQHVRRAFGPVARYLWDTNFDFPRVYRAYRGAERTLAQQYVGRF